MAKHRMLEHPGEEVTFKMKVLAKHKSAFERQVTEAVLIELGDDGRLLNSKGEFNRCVLPRLQVTVGEKVAEYEDNTIYNYDSSLTARKDSSKRKHKELSDNFEKVKSIEENLNVKKDPESKETLTEANDTSNSVRKILKPKKKSKNKISPPQNYDFIPLSKVFEKTETNPGVFGSIDWGLKNQDKRKPG